MCLPCIIVFQMLWAFALDFSTIVFLGQFVPNLWSCGYTQYFALKIEQFGFRLVISNIEFTKVSETWWEHGNIEQGKNSEIRQDVNKQTI